MASNNGYEKYKKVDVSTASQNRLIIMLYDGAIKFLETACVAMDKKHGTEEAHNNIVKAQEIIYELLSSLNYEAGDIANRLASIYTYMNQKLTEGNISKTKPPLLEVIRYLKELKIAWEGVEEQLAKGNIENKTSSANKKDDSSSSSSSGESKLNITG